jgi:1-acyl-sn-glycerol-3-phosphate acyltransferase
MSLSRRLARRVTVDVVRPMVVKRLGVVEGLEHIDRDEPFVLVSNHLSFYDHFVYGALLFAAQGRIPAFLTKAESFVGLRRAWFEEMGAVPVDREAPARQLLETTDRLLASGSTVVIYPEGTRARTPEMLPFKDGAARFAERAGVPVIPAALVGSREILPVGARYPRRGRVQVVFGPPLHPDPGLPRGRRIAELIRCCEEAVHALHARASQLADERPEEPSRRIAAVAHEAFERSFDPDDRVGPSTRRAQGALLLRIALAGAPDCLDAHAGRARLAGLRAIEGRALMRLPRIFAVRRGARRVLRRNPENLMANYVMGRWHLSVPALLGGRRERAVHHLALAEALGEGDTRYAMAHAEALLAVGRPESAAAAFDRVIAQPSATTRAANRRARALEQRAALAPSPAPRQAHTGAGAAVLPEVVVQEPSEA